MKKTNVALFLYFTAVLTALVLMTGCVSKHPRCAAYDEIEVTK
jgi:hypothetical protein